MNQVLPFPTLLVKGHIDLIQREDVGDKFIQLQLVVHVLVHQFRHILHTLPTFRRATT